MDSFASLAALIAAHPTGNPGDAYLAGGVLYVWDAATNSWKNMGSLIGPTGPAGATILDSYESYAALIAAHPTGNPGDAYLAGGVLYVWDTATNSWKNMGSLIGPTGPTGPAGVDGIVGEIAGIVATVGDLPATGAEQGTIYYVEATGELYIWDDDAGRWTLLEVAQGPRGATGPTGPAGADGIVGEIAGIVATVADLPTTGMTQGTIYYVEETGELYVWDAAAGNWALLDVAQGPRGATGPEGPTGPAGPTGADGADGLIGEIEGIVATVGDLPTTGMTQGTIYYVEGTGELYVWDDAIGDWILLDVAQGPRGAIGPTGPTGADGTVGSISGIVATVADLPTTGMTQGTIYYVEETGELYVWDAAAGRWALLDVAQGPRGATGPTGAQGPTGAAGPAATAIAIIPFASQQAPYVGTNNGGEAINAAPLGFGYMEYSGSISATANVSLPIDTNDKSFRMSDEANRQVAFSLPFDMTLNSLYITVGNWDTFLAYTPGALVYPYVQLYAAPAGSNTFLPIAGAVAKPEQGINPATAVAATMRDASVEGLNINIRAGTRIAICGMMEITGETTAREYWLYFTGGIGMTRWVQ